MAKMLSMSYAKECHVLYGGGRPCACCWDGYRGGSTSSVRRKQARNRQLIRQTQRTRERRHWTEEVTNMLNEQD